MDDKITGPIAELTAATAQLRVYEPLESFDDWAQAQILSSPRHSADYWDRYESQSLWRRSLRPVSDPYPHDEPEYFRSITVLDFQGREHTRYCPGQLTARCLLASEQAEESMRSEVFSLIAPPAAREANAQRVDAERLAADLTHLNIRTATWGIPMSWFTIFRPDDETEVVHNGDRLHTVRLVTDYPQAIDRMAWAVQVLAAHAPQSPIFEEIGQLGAWLENFDPGSVVELDYGALAEIVWPDDTVADLHDGLLALSDDDVTGAAAAYHRMTTRWLGPRHLGRAN